MSETEELIKLGEQYEKEGDKKKAFEVYQRAADLGNSEAFYKLGSYYFSCGGVAKAIEMYQRAADGGNASGINALGVCYFNGVGVPQDKNKAVEMYQRAGDLDNAKALFNLGVCYEKGEGVVQDKTKANDFYQRAADMGNEGAIEKIGALKTEVAWCKLSGFGGAKVDADEAVVLLTERVKDKDSEAMWILGICKEYGRGTRQDIEGAEELYKQSSESGNEVGKILFEKGKALECERGSGKMKINSL